jgi:NADPH:quinone reductase-like Zn-dependent oxidoreductase
MMKAIVQREYGPPEIVLELKEVEPPIPEDDEVLVRVHAASVNYSNAAFVSGDPFLVRIMGAGLLKPKFRILGTDIAGRVEVVGEDVAQFNPGDEVFGDLSDCGRGGYAEYVAVPEDAIALKPSNMSFEEAAAVPEAGAVALQGLREKGQIQAGEQVLIVGASGGIGTYAVQIAKAFGAEVTGVCGTRNLDLVRSIGADRVVDYTQEDFVENGRRYDLILATAGYRSIFDYARALTPKGRYVVTGGSMAQIFQPTLMGPFISMTGSKQVGNLLLEVNQDNLVALKKLIEAGQLRSVIDRCYPMSEIAAAIRYYREGHARGKVVIAME